MKKHHALKKHNALFVFTIIGIVIAISLTSIILSINAKLPDPGPTECYKILAPVCGIDGITYANDCLAKVAGVKIDYQGECETCPRINVLCPQEYDPVCGKDGKTYYNSCDAYVNCVDHTTPGECTTKNSKICVPPTRCDMYLNAPVCGKDGITYQNSCLALTACTDVVHEGACVTKDNGPTCPGYGMPCTTQYDPVCGVDGKTYSNACVAASNCVAIDYQGSCNITIAQ